MSQRASGPNEPDPEPLTPAHLPEVPSDRIVAMTRATVRGVDFRNARFDHFTLTDCLFVACDFRAMPLDRRYQPLFSARPRNVFRDCRFDGADLRRVRPDQARFERCTFDDAAIDGWRTEAAEFIGCRFAGALGTVTFFGRPAGNAGRAVEPERKRNEFTGNDFRDADLDRVTFTQGIDLSTQRLPASERYVRLDRFPQRLARARSAILEWEVHDERLAALEMLRDLATRYREQTEIIASRMSAAGPAARVQTRVWVALERAFG